MAERAAPAVDAPRRAPRAVRRAQILDAALVCFARDGYHGTTMNDLVDASGLSKGSLYWHFKSKEEVLVALFDQFNERFFEAWAPERHVGEDPLEVVREGIRTLVTEFLAQREVSQAWLAFFSHPIARERMEATYAASRALIGELLSRAAPGTLAGTAPALMASAFTAVAEGLLLQAIVDPNFDAATAVDAALEALIRGFSA